MSNGKLAAIHIHPVKSCRRLVVETAGVTALGLADDRTWQIVDGDGRPVTQRQHKALAAVQPQLLDGGLRLSAPGHDTVEVAAPSAADSEAKSLFGVSVQVHDAGDDAAAFFSTLTGEPCRLVAIADGGGWSIPEKFGLYDNPLAFVDAAPVLVATTSSLSWLQDHASEPFGMERFRPNLIIENDEAWVEDTWAEFTIGTTSLAMGMPWPRCPMPQIDQNTVDSLDVARHKEPAKALKEHRWCSDASTMPVGVRPILEGNGLFGIGCTIGPAGSLVTVGDPLDVVSSDNPLIAPPA
jgi:uncharacterized protein